MGETYKILFLVIILKISAIYVTNANNDYCKLGNCPNPRTHTLCRYNPESVNEGCRQRLLSIGLNAKQQHEIVRLHNELRTHVALGKEHRGSPGPQPRAVSMPNLTWDNELANIAQAWANQLCFDKISHDTCRNVEKFKVGQNVAYSSHSSHLTLTLTDGIQGWYDEVKLFNKHYVNNYHFSKTYGHYSQIVWADTRYIGCGQITYRSSKYQNLYSQVLVCNYGPNGNFEGRKVYQTY